MCVCLCVCVCVCACACVRVCACMRTRAIYRFTLRIDLLIENLEELRTLVKQKNTIQYPLAQLWRVRR